MADGDHTLNMVRTMLKFQKTQRQVRLPMLIVLD